MSKWISVDDDMPKIDFDKPGYDRYVRVMTSDGKNVRELKYVSNAYAKTEKGRAPRFEDPCGRIAHMKPTHWMPLPEPQK